MIVPLTNCNGSHISAYAPIAAMSLFTNILTHPNTRAQSDLEILVAATGIIQSIPLNMLSNEQTEHIKDLNDFIMELVRLGNCAVWMAKRKQGANKRAT